jgi:hypothetical protein
MMLTPYIFDHRTLQEGSITKTHVANDFKILCGTNGSNGTHGGTIGIVDLDWLNQPDPDEIICKKCKKIALKLLSKNETK